MNRVRNIVQMLISAAVFLAAAYGQDAKPEVPGQSAYELSSVDARPAHTVKAARQADWSSFETFRLLPAKYQPENPRHLLPPDQAQHLTVVLDSDLNRAFRDAGKGEGATLDIQPVIVDVRKSNTALNVVSFAAIQAAVSYGRASTKFQLIDDATGSLVGEVAIRGNAWPWNIYPWQVLSDFQPLGHSRVMLNRGAKALRKDLLKLRAMKPVQGDSLPVSAGN